MPAAARIWIEIETIEVQVLGAAPGRELARGGDVSRQAAAAPLEHPGLEARRRLEERPAQSVCKAFGPDAGPLIASMGGAQPDELGDILRARRTYPSQVPGGGRASPRFRCRPWRAQG